ncbi:MAG: SIS domain-containing protein [Kofleriaceae bacterium]
MSGQIVRQALVESVRVKAALDPAAITRAAELMRDAVLAGNKVLLCGNGGSAADAQHIAAELVGRFVVERKPLGAIALTTDTSALTAIANDYGYEHVFSRQVEALGAPGDVLIAITTSGTSKNVVAAVASARARGMKVIALTGAKGASFVASCDAGVAVPSTVTARIQECHILIGHVLCEVLDGAFATAPHPAGTNGHHSNGHHTNGQHHPAKLMTLPELVVWREAQRAAKRTVVWTNGAFDVFHAGHLASLRGALSHGDVLIVGVNSDASVRGYKGPDRPIFPVAERVAVLAALNIVDAITVFDDATPEAVLSAVRPDVHVKGGDYAPPHGKPIPERAIVEGYGGKIAFIPLVPDRSTTETIARLRK